MIEHKPTPNPKLLLAAEKTVEDGGQWHVPVAQAKRVERRTERHLGIPHALGRFVLAQLERDPPKRRFAAHARPHPLVVDEEPGQVDEPATGRLDATLRRELYEGGRPNGPLEVEVQVRFGQRA